MPLLNDLYLDKYTQYLNLLNEPTAKLISVLSKVNPRNISEVARAAGLSSSLAHYHLKRLISKRLLHISAKINYHKIGLRVAEVFIDIYPSKRKYVREILTSHDYGYYIASCYGRFNGYYVRFVIPMGKEIEFQLFLDELVKHNLIKNYDILWIDFMIYNSKWFNWFDYRNKCWLFKWDDWIKEICTNSRKVDLNKDTLPSPINPDYVDIFILKELYKDACISFKEIAKRAGLTPPAIRYHYYNHIVRFKFISGYRPVVLPYPMVMSDLHIFKITFENYKSLEKFISSLNGKPFPVGTAIIMGKNEVSSTIYLPKTELSNLISALISLSDIGIVSDFSYVTLNLKDYSHETIPYQRFINGKWTYNHEKYMGKIAKVAKKVERIYGL